MRTRIAASETIIEPGQVLTQPGVQLANLFGVHALTSLKATSPSIFANPPKSCNSKLAL
jgi:hypothetical protein